jgi:hypothetical protein
MPMLKRIIPTGDCFCGCGAQTSIGSYFLQGHDRRAESNVREMEYGPVVNFLAHHGYGPGGKNVQDSYEAWQAQQ